jgi:hypothetical protein
MSELESVYRQISCQKAVNGDNFSQGVQDYNFSIGGRTAWIPNRTYFRIGISLTGRAGAPTFSDQVAFADSVCGNLYNNVYFRAGGQDVSSIVSYVPQAQAVKNRIDKSGAWLKSVGKDAFFLDPDFNSRVARTSPVPSVADGILQYTKLSDPDNHHDYTVAIAAATGVVTGTLTTFNATLAAGNEILVNGTIYTVLAVASNTQLTVTPAPTLAVTTNATGSAMKVTRENDGGGRNVVYAMWQPPIGIFDETKPMGSGDYRIQLNPNAYYKTSAVEMKKLGIVGTDFNISIDSVELYVATCKQDLPVTGTETLHLMECQVHSKTLSQRTGDNMLDFTVPPSTKAITVFVQSGDSGSNTQIPPSVFKVKDGSDMNLNSIQIAYANQVKPSTRWTSEYNGTTNKMTQRYLDTQMETGMLFSHGGTESFADFTKRGAMYHYNWERDKDDRATQVQLNIAFGGAAGIEANANVFVCAHYTRTVEISIANGYITDVKSLSV